MSTLASSALSTYVAQQVTRGQTVVFDEIIFCNIPNLTASNLSANLNFPSASHIVHRQSISQTGFVNNNAVVYSVTLGTEVGDFDFNFIGLINRSLNLLAVGVYTNSIKKIKNKNGVQGNAITRSILLEFSNAKQVTNITIPAQTWQIDFTARLAGIDEKIRLTNRDLYGRAVFLGTGFQVSRTSGNNYSVQTGVGYIEGVRAELTQAVNLTLTRTGGIYVDVAHKGTVTGEYQTLVEITTSRTADYVDSDGVKHYVQKIATFNNSNIVDERSITWLDWSVIKNVPYAALSTQGLTSLYTGYDSQREDCALTPKTAFNLKSLIDANGRRFDGFIPLSKKSNAVDSTSSDTVATSYAAKLAYDKALEAKTAADNAQTTADNAQRTAEAKQSPATTLSGYGIEDFKIKEAESGANANDFKTDGHYYFASGSNLPGEGSWHMQVIAGSHSRGVRQIAKKTGSLETYERTFHKPTFGSGNWKAWKRTDTDGLPLGSVMAFPKQIANPQGFLLADGSTFNQQTYPDLYRSLGNSNQLPNLQRSDVGTLAYFPVDKIPSGWLECNGNGINREAFPELYDLLAPKYGTFPQSGLTWARLPNGEDRFIRSAGNGLRVGQLQDDEIKSHNHHYRDRYWAESGVRSGVNAEATNTTRIGSGSTDGDNSYFYYYNATTDNAGGTETRPKSIVFKLCIKALNGFDDVKFWIKAFGEVQNAGAMDASRLAQDIQAVRREKADLKHQHSSTDLTDFNASVMAIIEAFMQNFSSQNFAETGWSKLPNGLILQWGKVNKGWDYRTDRRIMFPIAFPRICVFVGLTEFTESWSYASTVQNRTKLNKSYVDIVSQRNDTMFLAVGF